MKCIKKLSLLILLPVLHLNSTNLPEILKPGEQETCLKPVDQKTCPRADGTWKKEWCWDWSRINTDDVEFPATFLMGSGTSAHQVEGDCTNNDRYLVESQKDEHGKPRLKEKSGKACDHWNRYKEDIQLMKDIGLNAYRFSVEWSKVEPKEGMFDEKALQHYADVCDELNRQGIEPVVNLHHYTNPIWFAQKDGFEKEENINCFVKFAVKVFERLKDKSKIWVTFNSPDAYAMKGYSEAMEPPYKKDRQLMGLVYINMLEAHVRVYQVCKKLASKEHKIGIMKNVFQLEPKGPFGAIGWRIARRLKENCFYDFFKKGLFSAYVPFMINVKHENSLAPESIDFVGISYYSHGYLQNYKPQNDTTRVATKNERYVLYAEGLYRAIQEVSELLTDELDIPIYIMENGTAAVSDETHTLFFKQYLYALSLAIQDGYDVAGYFYWALMDNYEWGTYKKRYGLYHVDFETQERTLKKGAEYFINIIKNNIRKSPEPQEQEENPQAFAA